MDIKVSSMRFRSACIAEAIKENLLSARNIDKRGFIPILKVSDTFKSLKLINAR